MESKTRNKNVRSVGVSKQFQADWWGRRDIPEWLDRCQTAETFIERFDSAAASREFKFMALQMAIVRWPQQGKKIAELATRHYPDRNLAQTYYP